MAQASASAGDDDKLDDEKSPEEIKSQEAAADAPNPMAKKVEKTEEEKKIEAAAEEFKEREGEVRNEEGLKAQKKKVAQLEKK